MPFSPSISYSLPTLDPFLKYDSSLSPASSPTDSTNSSPIT